MKGNDRLGEGRSIGPVVLFVSEQQMINPKYLSRACLKLARILNQEIGIIGNLEIGKLLLLSLLLFSFSFPFLSTSTCIIFCSYAHCSQVTAGGTHLATIFGGRNVSIPSPRTPSRNFKGILISVSSSLRRITANTYNRDA